MDRTRCCNLLFLLVIFPSAFPASNNTDEPFVFVETERGEETANTTISVSENDKKISIRKCCELKQVYYVNESGRGQCTDYASLDGVNSTFAELSQQLFFSENEEADFKISAGMPADCKPRNTIRLEPETIFSDRFFPFKSGHLVVPHRFWYFEPQHHCMEDFYFGSESSQPIRAAFVCLTELRNFPPSAIDRKGKLNFDFIASAKEISSPSTANITGKMVVRKCCDLNNVYAADSGFCDLSRGYGTQFFDDLQANGSIFLRTGNLACVNFEELTPPGTEFQLMPTGYMKMDNGDGFNIQVHPDFYCLDDFVRFSDDDLPETVNQAWYCGNQISYALPSEPSNDTVDIIESIEIPKCCPRGQIWSKEGCVVLKPETHPPVSKMEQVLLKTVRKQIIETESPANISFMESPDLFCIPQEMFLTDLDNDSWIFPHFRSDAGNASFKIRYLWTCPSSSWAMNLSIQHFCVEMEQFKTSSELAYYPVVRYCPPANTHVSVHYPILLYISAIALIATFVIYFIVPAQAVPKVAVGKGGQKTTNSRSKPTKLSDTLFGRNLLSQISALIISFLSLSMAQLESVVPGQPGCIVLGFILYFSSVASFTWLTVLSFDLWWQFRSSMKIPDNTRFIPYSAFAWGIPTFLVVLAIAAQFHPSVVPCSTNPRFGLIRCWFASDESMLAFFYAPVGAFTVLNLCFFVMLMFNLQIFKCSKGKDMAREARSSGSKGVASQKSNSLLAFEIFFITGIPWIFEILAWLPALRGQPWRIYFFAAVNLLNALRGVFVFVIFILLRPTVVRFLTASFKQSPLWIHKRLNRGYSTSVSAVALSSSASPSTTSIIISDSASVNSISEDRSSTTRPNSEITSL